MVKPTKLTPVQMFAVLGITFAASAVVFGAMYVMNQFSAEREGDEEQRVVTFTVPPPEPEPQQEPEPQPRREPRPTNRPALAPAPNLGASLGGIAVSTPEYAPEELGQVSESLLGDLEDVAMTEDTVDQKPVINTRPISYPERARQRGIEGRVVVSALIGTNGRVQDFRILEASPPGVFEEAVRNAVPNWTFEPAQYNGEPVETWATIPIPFSPN